MNTKTAEILCGINNSFYQEHYLSFARTRKASWPGWRRCLEAIGLTAAKDLGLDDSQSVDASAHRHISVLDLACGNLRFEAFLSTELPMVDMSFYAIDNCDDLVPSTPSVHYQSLDILDTLYKGLCLDDHITAPLCDLSVSFGFMHHIPTQDHRAEILASLIRRTRPGGHVLVSFWQFLNNEALGGKAWLEHERACEELGLQGQREELEDNDYLLGWENTPGAYRYCHSFSEAEIDQLVMSVAGMATTIARFVADGRTDNLNTYLILQVC